MLGGRERIADVVIRLRLRNPIRFEPAAAIRDQAIELPRGMGQGFNLYCAFLRRKDLGATARSSQ